MIPEKSSVNGQETINSRLSNEVFTTVNFDEESKMYVFIKRTLDIVISMLAIILLSPLMFIISILIKIEDPKGKVLFSQKRTGKDNQEFKMLKFRSMVSNAEQVLLSDQILYEKYIKNGYKLFEGEDPRLLKIGLFLRKSSLDELPQFFNVLKGDMSLVGPRPILNDELKNEYFENQAEFLSVKPGITGYWQAYGRNNITYPKRAEMEIYYIKHRNIKFDFLILCQTAISVLKREGAN